MLTTALLVLALLGIVAASTLVYRDAVGVGVAYPLLWAAAVFWTATIGLGLLLFVPRVPVPGALVLVVVGPVLYLFERDDAKHGDEPADPHLLPDAEDAREGDGSDDGRSDDDRSAGDERDAER